MIGVNHFLRTQNLNGESAFNEHIDGFLQKFGVHGLCFGSDFFGSDAPVFTDGDYGAFSRTKAALKKLGLKDTDIQKIFYKNAAEFLSFNLRANDGGAL